MEIKLPSDKIKKMRVESRKLRYLDNPQAITQSRLLHRQTLLLCFTVLPTIKEPWRKVTKTMRRRSD